MTQPGGEKSILISKIQIWSGERKVVLLMTKILRIKAKIRLVGCTIVEDIIPAQNVMRIANINILAVLAEEIIPPRLFMAKPISPPIKGLRRRCQIPNISPTQIL